MKRTFKQIMRVGGFSLVAALTSQAYAAGYKLEFQSASVLADAGEAAVVEDAGTNWYNAAGLVDLPFQVVLGAINIYAPTKFSGDVSAPSTLNMLPPPAPLFANNFAASGSASSHADTILPAIHYAMPINQRFSAGLSIVPAWGFTEDYGEGSIVRYNLTRVYTKSLDISPSLAMRITNQWSFGMGPDFHYFSAESKTHVRTQGTIAPIAGTTGDSISRFSADRWGYGLHAGVLYNYDDHTRVGVGYRSRMTQDLTGSSDFGLDTTGPLYETRAFKLALPLPSVTTFSIYHDFNPCWAVIGTVAYDQWSALRDYHARNYIQPPVPGNPSGILPNVTLPQDMSNTVDFGIGTHYRWNDNLMLRANFKYEPTPTKTVNRAVEFPDGVKYGIQIGARYQFSKKMALDFVYGHVFVKTMPIHDVNPVTNAVATGTAKTSIDLFGGQLVYNI